MVRFDLSRSTPEAATEPWRHPLDPDLGGPPPPARPLPPRRDPVLGRTRSVRRSMNYLSYRINIEPSQQRLRRYAGSAPTRRFLVLGHRASTDPTFPLDDLAGGA